MHTIATGPHDNPELNRILGDFVSTVIWDEPGRIKKFQALGVFNNGRQLIGAVLYHNHYPQEGVIELTAAAISPRWLTRPVLRRIFERPFLEWGCQLLVTRVSERNRGLCEQFRRLGFSEYRIPRLRGRNEAETIFTLTDDDWFAGPFLSSVHHRR